VLFSADLSRYLFKMKRSDWLTMVRLVGGSSAVYDVKY